MTLRAVQTLKAYDFRSDFSAAASSIDGDEVVLSAEEFSRLLEQARAAGRAAADAERADISAKLADFGEALSKALTDLAALATLLESAGLDAKERERSRLLIRRAAQSIIDGQGDLFADGT